MVSFEPSTSSDRSISWSADGFLDETIVTVVGDLVIAGAPGELVALSVLDGKERWRQKTGGSDRVATDGYGRLRRR